MPIYHLGYIEQLKASGLDSLELRRLQCDLLRTYKVLFGKLEMDYTDMFVIRSQSATRSHSWKLFPRHCRITACKHFFCECVIDATLSSPKLVPPLFRPTLRPWEGICSATVYRHSELYLQPCVLSLWRSLQQELIQQLILRTGEVVVGGDMRVEKSLFKSIKHHWNEDGWQLTKASGGASLQSSTGSVQQHAVPLYIKLSLIGIHPRNLSLSSVTQLMV